MEDQAKQMIADCSEERVVLHVDLERLGGRMRQLRRQSGVTLRTMAKTLGYSAPFISDCERGNRRLSVAALTCYLMVADRGIKQKATVDHNNDAHI